MSMNIESIAEVCHEANRAYSAGIGDNSQPHWDDAPDWQRQSAINGVKFHLANPDAGDSGSHENWMRDKLADGWKYGPTKDPAAKEHPCLVPFLQLPAQQRMKDGLFVAIVHALRDALGEKQSISQGDMGSLETVLGI